MLNSITINTHSSIRLEWEKIMYIDPFKLVNAPHDGDIIFITHSHFDHFSPDDIAKAAKPNAVYVMPVTMKPDAMKAGLPADRIVFCEPDSSYEVLGVPVETVPAYNIGKPMHPKENGWVGYVITCGYERIYIAGDTDATPEAAAVKCDIAMLPIGGTYTMDVKEAAELVKRMRKVHRVIPTHYGTLTGTPEDGRRFAEKAPCETYLKL